MYYLSSCLFSCNANQGYFVMCANNLTQFQSYGGSLKLNGYVFMLSKMFVNWTFTCICAICLTKNQISRGSRFVMRRKYMLIT